MADERISFVAFARIVVDAVEAAQLDYLIGGAVAVWAWGEPRTTQDFDLVIHLPGSRIRLLSEELEKRRMLVPRGFCWIYSCNRRATCLSTPFTSTAGTKQSCFSFAQETIFARRHWNGAAWSTSVIRSVASTYTRRMT